MLNSREKLFGRNNIKKTQGGFFMAIISGYQKMKDYIKQTSGYQLLSRWANANTLECDDGNTLQSKVGGISGISSSLTANSSTQAASTQLTNQLYQNITQFYGELTELENNIFPSYASFSQVASCSSNSSRGSSQNYQTTQAGWYCFNAELSRQATQEDMFKCSVSINNHKIAATSSFGDDFAAVFYLPAGITITISATFATATLYKIN